MLVMLDRSNKGYRYILYYRACISLNVKKVWMTHSPSAHTGWHAEDPLSLNCINLCFAVQVAIWDSGHLQAKAKEMDGTDLSVLGILSLKYQQITVVQEEENLKECVVIGKSPDLPIIYPVVNTILYQARGFPFFIFTAIWQQLLFLF